MIRRKYSVVEFLFLFFASFKRYDYFSEENVCFIKSQSLTACQSKDFDKREKILKSVPRVRIEFTTFRFLINN